MLVTRLTPFSRRWAALAVVALLAGACSIVNSPDDPIAAEDDGSGAAGGQGGQGGAGGSGGMQAACGDGVLASGEGCDDGNTAPGDGCSGGCTVESGYDCTGEPSVCEPICGDGLLLGQELCDDGNTQPGDGCDGACTVEAGYTCTGEPSVCAPVCGDGIVAAGESCDDGNTSSADGCDAGCQVEGGFTCIGEPSICEATCGDGMILGAETCDDGNATSTDGCDASCQVEAGYNCIGEPSICCPTGLTMCNGQCVDTDNNAAYCGSCFSSCGGTAICAQGTCMNGCQGGGVVQSVSPGKNMVVCDHPNDALCEQDFAVMCPPGWDLCSYSQHQNRNAGWNYGVSSANVVMGEISCRSGNGAGHWTLGPYDGATTLGQQLPFNCGYGSSRPGCTATYGCNEQYAKALCCAPTPTCGNGVVDSPEEQCDDANTSNLDACLSSCSWRKPSDNGIGGC